MFWNLIRQIKKSNSENLYAIKNQNGDKIFNAKDIKQYTQNFITKNCIQKEHHQYTTNLGLNSLKRKQKVFMKIENMKKTK